MADDDNNSSKIIRENMSGWSELPKELCQHILSTSTLKTVMRFKAVCPSWSAAVDEITKSPSFTWLPETTWLVLPRDLNKGEAIDGSRFYSLKGNFYNSNINMPEESRDAVCLGSSHGWLVLLNNQLEFMISTPFLSGIQLPLPPLKTFPDILGITYQKGTTYAYNIVDHFTLACKTSDEAKRPPSDKFLDFTSVKHLASKLRAKAGLSSRPTCSNKDKIGVMVMYIFEDRDNCRYNSLAFCTTSDYKWTKLEERRWYKEIMGCGNEFYVLKEDYSVDVWDFGTSSIPMKKMEIKPVACAILAEVRGRSPKVYMIKTVGTGLMLVVEYVHISQIQCRVYKLEGTTPVWQEVQSIGSNALVLGSNNSIVMSFHDSLRCDDDSIYYAQKSRPEPYSLHVFSLKDNSRKKFVNCQWTLNH